MTTADDLAHSALCALCDDERVVVPRTNARNILGDFLISNAEPCSEPALAAVDKVLSAEKSDPIRLDELPGAQWLAMGAVVNAANEQGLGCFQPTHRCIDNVLHRAAGPRLREECRQLMARRGPLTAGSPPLLTAGYHLNATHVLHVTGPALHPAGRQPSSEEESALSACYTGCLDAAAAAGIRSVAFCCISTGLFGYPSEAAAAVALSSVARWLHKRERQRSFDAIIFDVFTDKDEAAYSSLLPNLASAIGEEVSGATSPDARLGAPPEASTSVVAVDEAVQAIAESDKLLIVAAAGLSISMEKPNNPYHSAADFAHHYPAVARYGYRTSYEAMGLSRDERVPRAVRLAHMARHFLNMRHNFPPTRGYELLHTLAATYGADDTFVWTSNVDGAFERAGFEPSRVYQTQGEMRRLQCARPGCGTVWECTEQLRAIDAASPDGELTDLGLAPRCPKCDGDQYRPNLRGGDWFDPTPYAEAGRRLQTWLDGCIEEHARVAIIEVGVGPNTPVVTRIPACAFASALSLGGGHPVYVRINPDRPEGPREIPIGEVPFFRWRQPWTALEPLVNAAVALRRDKPMHQARPPPADEAREGDLTECDEWQARYQGMLASLRRPPT